MIDIRHLSAAPGDIERILMSPHRSEPTPRTPTRGLGCLLFSRKHNPLLCDQHWGPDRRWR